MRVIINCSLIKFVIALGFVRADQPRDPDRGRQQLPHLPRHDPHAAAAQRLLSLAYARQGQPAEGQEGHAEHAAAAVGAGIQRPAETNWYKKDIQLSAINSVDHFPSSS